MSKRPFLTAQWRHLAILNYLVEPSLLGGLVPRGTELDAWQGRTYVSVVGFLFLNTRILGVPVPFHRHFEEVNLRFYVRREAEDGWRRGVVFVKELVPKRAIAWVARAVYNENYVAVPMGHEIVRAEGSPLRTSEYHVQHPPWRVAAAMTSELRCDVAELYGPAFTKPLSTKPVSAFLAEGSEVAVDHAVRDIA